MRGFPPWQGEKPSSRRSARRCVSQGLGATSVALAAVAGVVGRIAGGLLPRRGS